MSFADLQKPQQMLEQIRAGLQGFGQPVSVVCNWPLLDPLPQVTKPTGWNAVCLSDSTPLTAAETTTYIAAVKIHHSRSG